MVIGLGGMCAGAAFISKLSLCSCTNFVHKYPCALLTSRAHHHMDVHFAAHFPLSCLGCCMVLFLVAFCLFLLAVQQSDLAFSVHAGHQHAQLLLLGLPAWAAATDSRSPAASAVWASVGSLNACDLALLFWAHCLHCWCCSSFLLGAAHAAATC